MMSTGGSVDAGDEITFEKILNSKEPMWDYAYQKIISTGGALKIPIDFGKVYAVVNSKTKAVVPLSSLNYLMMYKDSLQVVHAEWVVLQPDSSWLYGNRNQYSGKIRVSDWNGKLIKNLSYGKLPSYNAVSLKNKLKASTSPSLSSSDPEPPIFTCITFQRDGGSKCTCVDKSKCDMCDICARTICNIPPPECALCDNPPGNPGGGTGGGVGGGGGGSGGGGASPGDYSPSCNPDPNYVMPTTTPPAGTHWILPCNGPGVVPIPVESIPTSPILDHIINFMGITDAVKRNFLLEHNDIYLALDDYLVTNGNSSENKAFVNWAVEYLNANPNNIEDFVRDVFTGPDQYFSDRDAGNDNTLMNLTNIGNSTFTINGYDIYTPSVVLPDYDSNHPVSQAIYNFNPYIYYALLGANNTSLAHFHLTTKGMDAGDGYRKAIGAIGEGLFVSRLTSIPTSPPANMFVAKMFGTTHIDALVVRNIPFINGSGYEIAINYTDLDGNYQQMRMHHPDGLTVGPIKETTIAYEVKTLNAQANTPESLFKMLQEGVKQTRHRANISYMSAAVLVFDQEAWKKLKNSNLGPQAINEITSMSTIKNSDGEQKIFFRIEEGLTKDANRAFFALKDRIKNL